MARTWSAIVVQSPDLSSGRRKVSKAARGANKDCNGQIDTLTIYSIAITKFFAIAQQFVACAIKRIPSEVPNATTTAAEAW